MDSIINSRNFIEVPLMQKNFPEAKVTKTNAGHFLQEEVSIEIANALKRIIDEVI